MRHLIIFYIILCFLFAPSPNRTVWAQAPETTIADLFSQYADSIVLVGGMSKRKKHNKSGSGFIISEHGLIVTNHHIIKKAKRIFVKLHNGEVDDDVQIVHTDERKDIAILKINRRGLKPVQLGNSADLQIGQRVVTIGNPLGLENTVADGLISGFRNFNDQRVDLLQISVPLSSGSSGGPLFNLEGEVVGITTASISEGQNLNFAIPINYLKPMVQQLGHSLKKASAPRKNSRILLSNNSKAVSPTPIPEDRFTYYIVQPKDTLYSIAKHFSTSINGIMQMNNLETVSIYAGQRIKVPH